MKSNHRSAGSAALLSAVLALVPTASAQLDFGTDMPVMDWITPVIDSQRFGRMLQRNLAASSAAPSPAKVASLSYTPTPALKKATVDGYVSRLKVNNPAASQAVADNFGPGKYDYGSIFSGLVKPFRLRDDDTLDALTAYLVLGYMIVNDVQDGQTVTPAMVRGVRTQFGPVLVQNAKLTAAGVAGQVGEEFKLQTVIVQGGWQSAIRERSLPVYRQGIGAQFKAKWGLDFAALTLTGKGFAPK